MNAIKLELRKAITSPAFLLGCVVAFGILLYSGMGELGHGDASSDALSIFTFAFESNNALGLMPVAAAIPYAGVFCTDLQSESLRYQVTREGFRSYSVSKIIAAAIVGGLVVIFGCTLFYLFCIMWGCEPYSFADGRHGSLLGYAPYLELLHDGIAGAYFLFYAIAQFCYGGFWAVVGLCASVFIPYRYIAYASPFLIWSIFPNAVYFLHLPQFMNLAALSKLPIVDGPIANLSVVVAVYGVCIFAFALVFHVKARKKVLGD